MNRVVDRGAEKARLLARFRDELAGPPNGTEVAMRCTAHGRFMIWVSPPAPPCRVACPPVCSVPLLPEVAMARLLDDEIEPSARDRVRWAATVYDQVEQLKARIAELEAASGGGS